MEGYTKVTVSELSQNLVPCGSDSELNKIRFFLIRSFNEEEFRTQVSKVWIQGYVIEFSKNEETIEVAEEPVGRDRSGVRPSNVESVVVTSCDKVKLGIFKSVSNIIPKELDFQFIRKFCFLIKLTRD